MTNTSIRSERGILKMANGNITIENARLLFRNFAGKEGPYNAAGSRNFNVVLNPEDAEVMKQQGWNVRYLQPRDPEDEPLPILKVKVNMDGDYPPQIFQITSAGKTRLNKDTVANLDWAEFQNVDLVISPYHYEIHGRTGITAYLKALYATIVEDDLAAKYYDMPER